MKIKALDTIRKPDLIGVALKLSEAENEEINRIAKEERVAKNDLLRYVIKTFIEGYNET